MFKLARMMARGQLAILMKQLGLIQDDVRGPIDSFTSIITGGAWVGEDADAMVDEIATVVVPMVTDLIAAIGGMSTGINQAIDSIDQAEAKARSQVEDLVSTFGSIF